ncbi:MAG: metallophosphoesterase [Phycisphaerales bacterium]|nr:metallophosphoesterase [Phycisphaerales bacterium]
MRKWIRILLLMLCVWVVCAPLGAWVTHRAWIVGDDGWVRLLSNLTTILILPGWVTAMVFHWVGIGEGREDLVSIVIANVFGWGYLVVGGVGVCVVIRSVITKWKARSSADDQDEVDSEPVDHGRRAFLANSTLGSVAAVSAAALGYATLVEPWGIKVREYAIPIDGLDERLDGLRIVQVSDTHLGPRIPESFIVGAYARALELNPDLIVLTGDHVHDGTKENPRAAELCEPLVRGCPMGVIGVLGNHDWWGDGHQLSRMLSGVGVRMIDNDRVWIDAKTRSVVDSDPGEGALAFAGIGDLTDGVVDVDRAFRDLRDETVRIVLAHNPDTAEINALKLAGAHRVDLMVSGHTHGGQVKIPFIGTPIVPSWYGQKYAGGLVQGPAFRVVVSRGVGMSMLPVRVGVPPEIGVITLVRSAD